MNSRNPIYNLSEELNRVKFILEKILVHIHSIDEHFKPIEHELQEKEFLSRGIIVKRNPNFIVCLPTYSANDRKNYIQIKNILEKNSSEPSIIWIDDFTESNFTCIRITKLVETQFLKLVSDKMVIINLRFSQMIKPLETMPTLVIGKRYLLDDDDWLSQFALNLNQVDMQVFYDDSKFGGGPLVNNLIKSLHFPTGSIIAEFTLSHSAGKETSCVNAIFDSFSSLWM